jgi:hypothetical protein
VAAWPDGNDADAGMMPTASTPETGGRARSKSSLKTVTSAPAAATAPNAANVARGRHLRRQSPAAASAAINGHLTHHAEARSNRKVAGPQRMSSPKEEAAPSPARNVSSNQFNAAQDSWATKGHRITLR